MGKRETVPDVARNLSRWVDVVVAARVFSHRTLERARRARRVPVINGLSDLEHPCQALADFFTLWERGLTWPSCGWRWVGDGNNVCNSLLLPRPLLGTSAVVATPARLRAGRASTGGVPPAGRARSRLTTEAREARRGRRRDLHRHLDQHGPGGRAASSGCEAFQRYQVNDRLLGFAPGRRAGHALPARPPRRGDHRRGPRRPAQRWSSTRPRTGSTRRRRSS